MHMVPVGANLQELELIASLDPSTDVPQSLVNRRIEHRSSVFGRKHQMVEQNRDVMALVDVEAHPRDLRRKRRGMHPKGSRSLDLGWGIPERPGRYPNVKSRVISALRTLDTGQFFSAVRASSSNLSCSIPGTCARRVSADLEILKPSPSFSSETAASVASSVGVKPAAWSWKASAMAKQPAWAAAMSSSGLVPGSLSKRVLNE